LGENGEDRTREEMDCFSKDFSYRLEVIVYSGYFKNLLKTSLDKKKE
jgi:hypothetical protein